MNPQAKKSYGQILKSSAIIGGSSLVGIVIGAVRTKAMALMLGPSGVGLLGVYTSILDLAKGIAVVGAGTSGVREIADAAGRGDSAAFSRTVLTLRRLLIISGILCLLLFVVLSGLISKASFGDAGHSTSLMVLATAVILSAVSTGQMAVVRGVRRMADLARMNIFGACYGLIISLPLIYFYRESGIVPSLVCAAAMGALASWWYGRKVQIEAVELTWPQFSQETANILKLGLVFLSIMLMSLGVAYLVRIIVVRRLGVEAAGYYQAAWTVGALYVMSILEMMGADFLPRLSAVSKSTVNCIQVVNEQVEVNMLIGGPGVIATLSFSPLVILVFYSDKFGPATEVLRWICLGMSLRVASWPMGYMLIAKNARGVVFWSELLNRSLELGLIWICIRLFGLVGAGIGFFVSCVFYWFLIYSIVRHKYGFGWSANNKRIGLIYGSFILAGFSVWYLLPHAVVITGGTLVTLVAGYCSLKALCALLPFERLPRLAQETLALFRLAPITMADVDAP